MRRETEYISELRFWSYKFFKLGLGWGRQGKESKAVKTAPECTILNCKRSHWAAKLGTALRGPRGGAPGQRRLAPAVRKDPKITGVRDKCPRNCCRKSFECLITAAPSERKLPNSKKNNNQRGQGLGHVGRVSNFGQVPAKYLVPEVSNSS